MLKNPFLVGFFLFGLIGILIATRQVHLPQVFLPKANVLGVTLSVLPSNTALEVGQETSFDINLNPANESVSAIELILNFDQNIIEVTNIKPTDALPQILGVDLTKPGKASAVLLVNPGNTQTAQGVIARVYIKAKKAGNSSLKFDQSTKVSAIGKTGDVTGANEGSEITVSGGGSVATVTPSLSPTVPADTSQADAVIKQYLTEKATGSEGSPSANLVKTLSNYIQKSIEEINLQIEKQARRFLD